ncbi:amidohydrolase [Xylaria bambusicola]|uniref:amidohydrolase n=1 Tax=Xylaria bambusicola TaxID=326684 RepID=UPI002007A0E7|nr:amidohydrolase [Xylaria bambusicola]KAI0515104.1 amidohydrolase [Xylaria bambusicola]
MRSTLLASLAGYSGAALSASTLLSGGTIIAFDEDSKSLSVIRDGALLVTDDRIAGLYDEASPEDIPADTEVVDCTHKIITPGFIDTHRHGWQTAFKTLGSNTTLADYFLTWSSPAANHLFTAEDVYDGQLTGLLEAINAGVTTTLDHAHSMWSTDRAEAGLEASIESGARVIWAPAIDPTPNYPFADQIKDWKRWNRRSFPNDLVTLGIAYDGWDIGVPENTLALAKLIKDAKPPVLTIHWLGGAWPIDSSPALVHSFGVLNTSTAVVFSHGVGITAASADLLRSTNQFLSITPESEMHCGHGHTYSHHIHEQAALGVDTHLAFSTDIITQARLWLQRTRSRLFDEVLDHWHIPAKNPMSVNQAFLLATRQGGLALRRPDLGVIRPGAKADLVIFNGRSPSLLGWADPVAAVILHANVGDIEHVLVDGKFVKRDGKLTYEKYPELVESFLKSAERIRAKALERPEPVLTGTFFGAEGRCFYADAEQVDVVRGEGTGYGPLFRDTSDKSSAKAASGKKHDEL